MTKYTPCQDKERYKETLSFFPIDAEASRGLFLVRRKLENYHDDIICSMKVRELKRNTDSIAANVHAYYNAGARYYVNMKIPEAGEIIGDTYPDEDDIRARVKKILRNFGLNPKKYYVDLLDYAIDDDENFSSSHDEKSDDEIISDLKKGDLSVRRDAKGEEYFLHAYPKTMKAAIELAKKKEQLERYNKHNGRIDVDKDLKLYSDHKNIKPSDIASLSMMWHTNPLDDDKKKEAKMLEEIKEKFRKVGIDPSDYKYDFIGQYLW